MTSRYISFQLELIVSSIGDSCDILHFMVTWGGIAPIVYENEHCGGYESFEYLVREGFVHFKSFCCCNLYASRLWVSSTLNCYRE